MLDLKGSSGLDMALSQGPEKRTNTTVVKCFADETEWYVVDFKEENEKKIMNEFGKCLAFVFYVVASWPV